MTDDDNQTNKVTQQKYSTGEGKRRDDILPTQDVTQNPEVDGTGTDTGISGTSTVYNSGPVPQRSMVTRVEVEVEGGTFRADSSVEGTAVSTNLGDTGSPYRESQSVSDGGLHVIPENGSLTVDLTDPNGGTIDLAAVNTRIVPLQ